MAFYVVQPYGSGAERLKTATMVRSFERLDEACAELERVAERLQEQGIPGDPIELVVVDDRRERVRNGH